MKSTFWDMVLIIWQSTSWIASCGSVSWLRKYIGEMPVSHCRFRLNAPMYANICMQKLESITAYDRLSVLKNCID